MSILPKNICNMHIARRNMHIAIESILSLTHTLGRGVLGSLSDAHKQTHHLGHKTSFLQVENMWIFGTKNNGHNACRSQICRFTDSQHT